MFRALALSLLALAAFAAGAVAQGGAAERWFEIDEFRPVWSDPPAGIDLTSPRSTLRSFITALDQGRAEAAAAALHLPERALHPPEALARMLGEVIERRLWIDWDDVPGRRDAAAEPPLTQGAALGAARRSLLLGAIDLDAWPIEIRLNRLKPPNAEPVWVFARSTVEAAPALHAAYGPGWVERAAPAWWREESWRSVRRWEFVALPLLLGGALLLALLVRALLTLALRIFRRGWKRRALADARSPLALLAGAVAARIALDHLVAFSGPVTAFLSPTILGVIILAVTLAALRAIDAGLDVVTRRFVGQGDASENRDERQFYTSIYALRRLVALVAVALAAALLMWELDLFAGVGLSLLASAGVAAVILGVAAQTVLGNILASLQIALAKPIRIGDSVLYEGEWSYVESIFYTFVRLRTWDERRLIVPVQYFISNPFENWTMKDAKMTRTFYLIFDHAADTEAIRRRYLEIAKQDEDVLEDEMLKMLVLDHTAEGVRCRFYATAADPSTAWNMHARLQEKVLVWVRETHPEWWPRERVMDAPDRRKRDAAAAVA